MTSRRAFLAAVGGGLLAAPRAARAQSTGTTHRIGFLGGGSAAGYAPFVEALRLGLRDHGYVEGKSFAIEYRWAEGKYERLPALAAELVGLKVDLIVTQGTPAALAAKTATGTIPIVMAIVGNPVETKIVASLARPGGNITGSSFFWGELCAKRLEMLKTALPGLARAGVLTNPDNAAMVSLWRALDEMARALNIQLQPLNVRVAAEIDAAFKLARAQTDALVVLDDGVFISGVRRVAEASTRTRMPGIGFREYCEAGGLLAYSVDFPDIWRQGAVLVDKILKGARPADLPIQQATKFELLINARTAKALALTLPAPMLARANQVIE